MLLRQDFSMITRSLQCANQSERDPNDFTLSVWLGLFDPVCRSQRAHAAQLSL